MLLFYHVCVFGMWSFYGCFMAVYIIDLCASGFFYDPVSSMCIQECPSLYYGDTVTGNCTESKLHVMQELPYTRVYAGNLQECIQLKCSVKFGLHAS